MAFNSKPLLVVDYSYKVTFCFNSVKIYSMLSCFSDMMSRLSFKDFEFSMIVFFFSSIYFKKTSFLSIYLMISSNFMSQNEISEYLMMALIDSCSASTLSIFLAMEWNILIMVSISQCKVMSREQNSLLASLAFNFICL